MREEEVDSLVAEEIARSEKENAEMTSMIVGGVTKVFETIFADFNENIESAARDCRNNDASTALRNVSSAIEIMDIPYLVKEALGVPHG